MSAFGMSRYGRDARDRLENSAISQDQRAKDAWGRANSYYDQGNYFQDFLANQYTNMANGTFGSAADLTDRGREIMPWMDQMLADRRNRVNQQLENYNAIGPISATIGDHSGRYDEIGQNIGRNFDALSGDINDLSNRQFDREEGFNDTIRGNITGTYGALTGQNNDSYGGLMADARNTYDRAISDLGPGSEARAATAARAFAPQMASQMMRLRRAGIDPASSEAQSLLRNIEGQRSRALDDALGQANRDAANLRIDRFGVTSGLERERLGNERGLGLGQMDDLNRESERSLNARQGLDRDVTGMRMQNRQNYYQDTQNFNADRAANDLLYRNLRVDDVNNRNAGLERMNNEDAFAHDMQMSRFDAGVDARGRDIQYQQAGRAGLGDIRNNYYNQGNFQDQYGNASMAAANNVNMPLWQTADANGNWLGKFLGGAAATAASGLMKRIPGFQKP